jgi:hypothetical protein
MEAPPDIRPQGLTTDAELVRAIGYYANRASRLNPQGTSRRILRRLLMEYDLRVAALLTAREDGGPA